MKSSANDELAAPVAWRYPGNLSDDVVQQDCFAQSFIAWLAAPSQLPLAIRRERYEKEFIPLHGSHRHLDFYALYVVAGGHGTHFIDDEAFGMARGDVYLMTPGSIHDYRVPDFVEVDAIYFQSEALTEAQRAALEDWSGLQMLADSNQKNLVTRRLHLSPTRHSDVLKSIFEMIRNLDEASLVSIELARAGLFALLAQLVRWKRSSAGVVARRRIDTKVGLEKVLEFCEERFHEPLAISQMAALMHLAPGYFSVVFTREMGMAPTVYLRQVRLERAQTLLRNTRHPISEIASLSGFGSAAHFSRAFRQAFDITPLECRRAHAKDFGL